MTATPMPPPVASGYSYPVMPAASVTAMHRKLSPKMVWIIAGGAIAVVVVVVTLIVVLARPTTTPCHFSCITPKAGIPLVSSTVYDNSNFGYGFEYINGQFPNGATMSLGSTSDSGATINMSDGSQLVYTASHGSDVDAAVQTAINGIDTTAFQDMLQVGPVRGAEIGLVLGHGSAFTANYVPPGSGGQASKVGIVVMAVARNNLVITTVMFSPYVNDVSALPYGLQDGSMFDYPITLTHFHS